MGLRPPEQLEGGTGDGFLVLRIITLWAVPGDAVRPSPFVPWLSC